MGLIGVLRDSGLGLIKVEGLGSLGIGVSWGSGFKAIDAWTGGVIRLSIRGLRFIGCHNVPDRGLQQLEKGGY